MADPLDPPQSLGSLAEYEALEKLAKAATPGPWETKTMSWTWNGWSGEELLTCGVLVNGDLEVLQHDAAFIAAANPTTVLALLAEIRRLRALMDSERAEKERTAQALSDDEIRRAAEEIG